MFRSVGYLPPKEKIGGCNKQTGPAVQVTNLEKFFVKGREFGAHAWAHAPRMNCFCATTSRAPNPSPLNLFELDSWESYLASFPVRQPPWHPSLTSIQLQHTGPYFPYLVSVVSSRLLSPNYSISLFNKSFSFLFSIAFSKIGNTSTTLPSFNLASRKRIDCSPVQVSTRVSASCYQSRG